MPPRTQFVYIFCVGSYRTLWLQVTLVFVLNELGDRGISQNNNSFFRCILNLQRME